MRLFETIFLSIFSIPLMCGAVNACMMAVGKDLNDIEFADVVVVGKITDYQIVVDVKASERAEKTYKSFYQGLPEESRESWPSPTAGLVDFALFQFEIDEVLRGDVNGSLTVTWNNHPTKKRKYLLETQFLIALQSGSFPQPMHRDSSAPIFRHPQGGDQRPGNWSVMATPCAGPFIFQSTSENAVTVRRIVGSWFYRVWYRWWNAT